MEQAWSYPRQCIPIQSKSRNPTFPRAPVIYTSHTKKANQDKACKSIKIRYPWCSRHNAFPLPSAGTGTKRPLETANDVNGSALLYYSRLLLKGSSLKLETLKPGKQTRSCPFPALLTPLYNLPTLLFSRWRNLPRSLIEILYLFLNNSFIDCKQCADTTSDQDTWPASVEC